MNGTSSKDWLLLLNPIYVVALAEYAESDRGTVLKGRFLVEQNTVVDLDIVVGFDIEVVVEFDSCYLVGYCDV